MRSSAREFGGQQMAEVLTLAKHATGIRAVGKSDHLVKDAPFSNMETQVQTTKVKLFVVQGTWRYP